MSKRTSQRWKALERTTAELLQGRRVTEPWQLFRERPDVIAEAGDKRLVVECKAYARHAHHRFLEKCSDAYCEHANDIPVLVTREPGREAYATIPLSFLKTLLETMREAP